MRDREFDTAVHQTFVGKLVELARTNATLLSNAAFMTGGAVASAILGFLFWTVAARHVTAASLGLASAAISAMSVLVSLAEIGLGTLLMGFDLRDKKDSPKLNSAALITVTATSTLFCIVWFAIVNALDLKLKSLLLGAGASLLFLAGVAGGAVTLVTDSILTALSASSLRMVREIIFASAKLLLLALLLRSTASGEPGTILFAWVAASLLSISVVAVALHRRGSPALSTPNFSALVSMFPKTIAHHALNLVASVPTIALPTLLTEIVSPEANAPFFMALMIIQVLLLVPASISTSLYAIGGTATGSKVKAFRFAILISSACCLAEVFLFVELLNVLLTFLNPHLAELAGSSLKYLGLAMLPRSLKFFYIAAVRLEDRVFTGSYLMTFCAVIELGGAAVGCVAAGMPGLIAGWLIAAVLETALMLPTLLAAANVSLPPGLAARWRWTRLFAARFAPAVEIPAGGNHAPITTKK
jgi:O-antigen/teichoic acid export membrane protein